MVGGFNTNVRYLGRVFHVQTEDSGAANPHIITLLYEGGAILFKKKQGYEDQLGVADLEETVRGLMEEQHRTTVQALKNGALDDAVGLAEEITQSDVSLPSAASFGEGVLTGAPMHEVVLAHFARS